MTRPKTASPPTKGEPTSKNTVLGKNIAKEKCSIEHNEGNCDAAAFPLSEPHSFPLPTILSSASLTQKNNASTRPDTDKRNDLHRPSSTPIRQSRTQNVDLKNDAGGKSLTVAHEKLKMSKKNSADRRNVILVSPLTTTTQPGSENCVTVPTALEGSEKQVVLTSGHRGAVLDKPQVENLLLDCTRRHTYSAEPRFRCEIPFNIASTNSLNAAEKSGKGKSKRIFLENRCKFKAIVGGPNDDPPPRSESSWDGSTDGNTASLFESRRTAFRNFQLGENDDTCHGDADNFKCRSRFKEDFAPFAQQNDDGQRLSRPQLDISVPLHQNSTLPSFEHSLNPFPFCGDTSVPARSSFDHGASPKLSKKTRDTDFGEDARPHLRTSLTIQVLALLQRNARQYWRRKFSVLAELCVPLVFVILLIILNVSFGGETIYETVEINYSYFVKVNAYANILCYNDPETPIPTLHNCDIHRLNKKKVICEGDETGIPVKGLCVSQMGSYTQWIDAFLSSFFQHPIALPSFESIILTQWIAKKARLAEDSWSRTAMAAFSQMGFGGAGKNRFDSICYSGFLYFAPADKVPKDLMSYLHAVSPLFRYVNGGVFDTVEEAREWIKKMPKDPLSINSTWGLVIINDIVTSFDIQIELHFTALPRVKPIVDISYRTGFNFDGSDMHLASGFITIQRTMYDYFIYSQKEADAIQIDFNPEKVYPLISPVPVTKDKRYYLLNTSAFLVSFIIILAFLYPFSQMTKRLVLEKELRIQEAMLIMGLKRQALWLCFFILSFMEMLFICIFITILLCINVVTHSNPFVIFLILLLYSCTLIPLVALVSTFFAKARLAALIAPMVYFILAMLVFSMNNVTEKVTIALSFFSPTALATLMNAVFTLDRGKGFKASDFQNSYLSPKPACIMGILAADFFIYLLLMFYADAVVPQPWGSTISPFFFIHKPYRMLCRCFRRKNRRAATSFTECRSQSHPVSFLFDPNAHIDLSNGQLKKINIELDGIHKAFKRDGKRSVVVDDLSWKIYHDEISVLLGPNGTGKSTIINMITGMLTPDKGDCVVGGYSVRESPSAVRSLIGFCPQHNILWPDLTCREHLEFFNGIKGLRGAEMADAVWDILVAIDLTDKIDYLPFMLSGGQRRKLSIAIAFAGLTKIILLDEPTSGMDAVARRHTWSLLRTMAKNRTILLTTHFMDEANLLGDYIGIIKDGRLRCTGSSLFLRSHAGIGYMLRFNLLPLGSTTQPQDELATAEERRRRCEDRAAYLHQLQQMLRQTVTQFAPDTQCVHQSHTEIEFRLPLESEDILPDLLRCLEDKGNRALGVRSYDLCAPTMEDVFFSVINDKKYKESINSFQKHLLVPALHFPDQPAQGRSSCVMGEGTENDGIFTKEDQESKVATARPVGIPPVLCASSPLVGEQAIPMEKNLSCPSKFETRNGMTPITLAAETTPTLGTVGSPKKPLHLPKLRTSASLSSRCPSITSHEPLANSSETKFPSTENSKDNFQDCWNICRETKRTSLQCLQLKAILFMRFRYASRDYQLIFFQIVCPVFCILLAMLLQTVKSDTSAFLSFDPTIFKEETQSHVSRCKGMLGDLHQDDFLNRVGHHLNNTHWNESGFITGRELGWYMQDTWYINPYLQLSSWQCKDPRLLQYLEWCCSAVIRGKETITMYYNTTSKHSLPNTLSITYALLYLRGLMQSGRYDDATIRDKVFRTNLTALPHGTFVDDTASSTSTILIGIIVMIPFSFLPANSVVWVVKERQIGARHLQKLTGMNYVLYWFGNFLFDFLAYIVSMLLVVLIFAIFKRWEYVGSDVIGASFLSFILYGLCCCFGAYAVNFFFHEHTGAQVVVMGASFLTGFVCVIIVFVLSLVSFTQHAAKVMRWIFRLIPPYAIGEVILNLALLEEKRKEDPSLSAWSGNITVWADVFMAVEIPFLAAFTLFWDHPERRSFLKHMQRLFCFGQMKKGVKEESDEHPLDQRSLTPNPLDEEGNGEGQRICRTRTCDSGMGGTALRTGIEKKREEEFLHQVGAPPRVGLWSFLYPPPELEDDDFETLKNEDDDVKDERQEVYNDEKKKSKLDVVRLVDLRKKYSQSKKVSVRSLSFGVMPGEVFGFLGINGAGKSTVISILTQEKRPTSGRAYICGYDTLRDSARAMQCIGYCPQFDACFDLLTVSEHLSFYISIHGIPESQHKKIKQSLLELSGLTSYANVLFSNLSGGNRRKLSVALSIIGSPEVVFLDEPSAGMDPIARRCMWCALKKIAQHCTIVLTTHHLEEVEAMASCVAIMMDGGLRCIGDLSHLKHKYSHNAYELHIRVGSAKQVNMIGRGSYHSGTSIGPSVLPTQGSLGNMANLSTNASGLSTPHYTFMQSRRSGAGSTQGSQRISKLSSVKQFMEFYFPSAMLIENFNDERYVYSIPATRDVARALRYLKIAKQNRHARTGSGFSSASVNFDRNVLESVVRLSEVFGKIQEYQETLSILDYSVTQASLEQVFLRVSDFEEGEREACAASYMASMLDDDQTLIHLQTQSPGRGVSLLASNANISRVSTSNAPGTPQFNHLRTFSCNTPILRNIPNLIERSATNSLYGKFGALSFAQYRRLYALESKNDMLWKENAGGP